jgi:hypothetical protein
MNTVENQYRVEPGCSATGKRNHCDVAYELGPLILHPRRLTDEAQIERWINEGGALKQEMFNGFTQQPHN